MKVDKSYFKHIQIGIELAVFVLIGFFVGYKVDGHFQTSPWFVLLGSVLGICFGLYVVLKELLGDK